MAGSFTWLSIVALLLFPAKEHQPEPAKSLWGKRSFTGKITYEVIYESKSPFVSVADLEELYGTRAVMYIKDDNYMMTFNGNYTGSMLYIGKENRQLVTFSEKDSSLWRDCDRYDSEHIRTYEAAKMTVVMGRRCNELLIETDWGVTRYYYDPHIYMRPNGFRHHGFNYFNLYLRRAKAPYLKYEYDGPNFKRTLIAIDMTEEDLSADIFKPNVKVAMSRGL